MLVAAVRLMPTLQQVWRRPARSLGRLLLCAIAVAALLGSAAWESGAAQAGPSRRQGGGLGVAALPLFDDWRASRFAPVLHAYLRDVSAPALRSPTLPRALVYQCHFGCGGIGDRV